MYKGINPILFPSEILEFFVQKKMKSEISKNKFQKLQKSNNKDEFYFLV